MSSQAPVHAGALTVHRGSDHLSVSGAAATGKRVRGTHHGALHDGQLQLVRAAAVAGNTVVIASISQPLSSARREPRRLSRTFDQDCAKLPRRVSRWLRADRRGMYTNGRAPPCAGEVADAGGGAAADHFSGMLTVVNKLLNIAAPHAAYFGERYQHWCW